MKRMPVYLTDELWEEQLLYQLVLYLPLEVLKLAGQGKLETLIETASALGEGPETLPAVKRRIEGCLPLIRLLMGHRQEYHLCRMEAMSWLDLDRDGSPDYPETGLVACAFINSAANTVSVVFRGTPAGAWMDNAKMLIGDKLYTSPYLSPNGQTWNYLSPMQAEAMHFVTGVIARYGELWKNFYSRCVSGHSKGGNQAQLVVMLFRDYFDIGLSVDSPGMSRELCAELAEKLGDRRYAEAASRLYSLNASNDYVHSLGEMLIPIRNCIWVSEQSTHHPLLGSHYLQALLHPETGAIMPMAEAPGPMANFISKLSEVVMGLPAGDRSAVFMSLMGFAQMFIGRALPVNPEHEDWLRFVAELDNGTVKALGIILCVLLNTREGQDFRVYLSKIGIMDNINDFCDRTVQWYLKLPLAEKIKKTKGVAVVMIAKVTLMALLTKIMSMAEILQRLRETMVRTSEMGMAMMAAYTQLVGILVHGYLEVTEKIREELQGIAPLPELV